MLIHIDVITSLSLVLFLCTFYKKLLPPELRYVEPRKTFEKGLFAEKIIGQPALFLSLLGVVVVSLAHLSALPALFVSRGLPALQWTSIVLIVNSVTVVIFGPFLWLGVIGLSTKLQLAIGISLMAVGNVLVGFWHSFYGVVFTTVVWSMGEVLLYPVFALVVLRQFSQECRGVGTAFKSSIIQAALFLCPIMTAGMLAISTERYHFLYILVFGSLPLVGYFAISKAIERD
ncbi:MAG: hypothetical protein EA369_04230 [Bradymonadales bacterium]|nr:MAG: hypothetical protein EA369_04230 [Bradymonadales bacterium]